MAYQAISSASWKQDTLARKEFYALRRGPGERNYRVAEADYTDMLAGKYLNVHAHQLFARNFLSPDTPWPRLHLAHAPGTGKTLAAVACAQSYIASYLLVYANEAVRLPPNRRNMSELERITPSVFVLGFAGTKGAFTRELLRYPEFGFISAVERAEYTRRIATQQTPDDVRALAEYKTMLKKRLTNRARGGFYRFLGYDEFVNRLFLSETVKLVDLELEAMRAESPLEDIIRAHIADGSIQVNAALLEMFRDSLIIADEIHNTYNTAMKNNRGVALQYVLDTVPSVRLLSLSATPINNVAPEAVDFLNYLVPPADKLKRSDVFTTRRTPKPGGIERLGALSRGRISFLQDVNLEFYPRRIFAGETIVIDNVPIPYLKFTRCPMSPLHAETLRRLIADSDDARVPTDSYAINDVVYPNPDSASVGLYRSADVRAKISGSSQEWRDQVGVVVHKGIAGGPFLHRDNVGKYSAKAAELIDILYESIRRDGGKVMVYHDRVRTSGVLFWAELLRANGFADETSEPVDSTICARCGAPLCRHDNAHQYVPARFVVAHFDVERATMEQSLTRYSASDNAQGHRYLVLLGGRIIRESYDMKCVRTLVIMSLPTNIPTTIQVFGRVIRKNSHVDLPADQRTATILILVSTWADSADATPELQRYIDKIEDYKVIQAVEREFNRHAVDADVFRDIVMPPPMIAEYFPSGQSQPVASIGNLYFEPAEKLATTVVSPVTFRAYGHFTEEIATITYIIKRSFLDEPVWTYDSLWARVKDPPTGLETNPALFDELNFVIALNNLVERATSITAKRDRADAITTLFDPATRYIFRGGVRHKIEQVDRFYVLFPVEDAVESLFDAPTSAFMPAATNRAVIDVDSFRRPVRGRTHVSVGVAAYVESDRMAMNYAALRSAFIERATSLTDAELIIAYLFDTSERFQISFVEEAIVALLTDVDTMTLHARVVLLLSKFRAIIYPPEVKVYKGTASAYKSGVPKVAATIPLGYQAAKTVRLFDPAEAKWIEVSRTSLNRHMRYKEPDVIVAYLESAANSMRFKLRSPVHLIRRGATPDSRTIERGIVCATKSKHELLKIVGALGISAADLGADTRVKSLCDAIRDRLIALEMKERARDGRYKHVYSWWDEMVVLKD